jgi:hypothetical protein
VFWDQARGELIRKMLREGGNGCFRLHDFSIAAGYSHIIVVYRVMEA